MKLGAKGRGMGALGIISLCLLSIAGMAMAPVAALLCGAFAWWRKRSILQFAGEGALNGLLLLPWVLVLVKIRGRSAPLAALLIYLFPYAIWLGVCALIGEGIRNIWANTLGTSSGYVAPHANPFTAALMTILFGLCAAVNLGTLFLSARSIFRRYRQDRIAGRSPEMIYYAHPFISAYVWLGALVVLGLIRFAYVIDIGVNEQIF